MNKNIHIGHIADCHLCNRQYGHESRGADFLRGAMSALSALRKSGVSLVLCSGDLLDTVNPGSKVCITQLSNLREFLKANGQLMLVVAGNHDNASPHWCSAMKDTPETGGIYYLDDEVYVYSETGGLPGITITGRSYADADAYREWMETAPAADILMYHLEVADAVGYAGENMITVEELAKTDKWKVVAAGHIHKQFDATCKTPSNRVMTFTYPGSTELCEGGEPSDKTANILTMAYNGSEWVLDDLERVPFETRPVQKFKITTEEELTEACRDVEPGGIVFVVFDRAVTSVHTMLKSAADRKATIEAGNKWCRTIFRMQPMLSTSEREVLEKIQGGRCVSLREYMNEVSSEYFSEEESQRGLTSLCMLLLDSGTDHRAVLDEFVTERLDGKILI